ncbi:hypothetical protein BC829DRAFT_433511 [Chytridium lagenaria]|nr:hypothetical protein BC829DRAFT_433511 [Chytridium lagenaria]
MFKKTDISSAKSKVPLILLILILGLNIGCIFLHHQAIEEPAWLVLKSSIHPPKNFFKSSVQIDVIIKFGFDIVCTSVNDGKLFCMDPPPCGPLCSRWSAAKVSSWVTRIAMYLSAVGTIWLAITWKKEPRRILIDGLLGLLGLTAASSVILLAVISSIRPDLDVDISSVVNLPLINSVAADPIAELDSSFFMELAVCLLMVINVGVFVFVRRSLMRSSSFASA